MEKETMEIIRERVEKMNRKQLILLNQVLDVLESRQLNPESSKEQVQGQN